MRTQLRCIARIHVVYLKQLTPCFSHGTTLFPLSPLSPRSTETKCRTDANSSSRKKGLTKPGSLTNTNLIEKTNRIEKNCLFCILSPVPLLPRALRNRSDYIDIPSTNIGHRKDLGDPPKHESQNLSENGFLFEECITAWISSH